MQDIIAEQDEFKAHTQEFTLWPRKWQACDCVPMQTWSIHRLATEERRRIPNGPGIYTLLVQPGIVRHPACSYLMYVGQALSLRRRFGDYLTRERRAQGRPKIFRLLSKYSDYVWFCYTVVPRENLQEVEDALISGFIPPCNDRLRAELRPAKGAF
jgi:excinuclease UvrABC nuclease subunit